MKGYRFIIGIDAGANGGIAIWDVARYEATTVKMPRNVTALRPLLEHYASIGNTIVFLEKLSVRPDDIAVSGGQANMGKLFRIQKMISGFEQLKATIAITGIPFAQVHPMTWMSALNVRIKGEEKKERKERFKRIAMEWYPSVKVTLWNADALLIMRFGSFIIDNTKWMRDHLENNNQDKLL